MKLLTAVTAFLIGLPCLRGDDWELVYPEEYPVAERLPFLSIGNRERNFMIGSQSGFILLDYWDLLADPDNQPAFVTDRATTLKLPISFDIHAVSSVEDQWILGGPQGQVAIHTAPPYNHEWTEEAFFPYDSNHLDWLLDDWEFHSVPTKKTVVKFAVQGADMLILANWHYFPDYHRGENAVFASHDKGETWTEIDDLRIFDIQEFNDAFYILARTKYEDMGINGMITTLGLLRSPTGTDWELLWEVTAPGGYVLRARMMVLGDTSIGDYQWEDFPFGERLFIQAEFNSIYRYVGGHELSVSTVDGETWFDNGSKKLPSGPNGVGLNSPWNPLELPEAFLFSHSPGWADLQQVRGIYRLSPSQVEVNHEQQWINGLSSATMGIQPETISHWTDLSFMDGSSTIATITHDGFLSHPVPEIEGETTSWEQMVVAGGTYFIAAGFPNVPNPYSKLAMSTDLETWQLIDPPPGSGLIKLIPMERTVAAFYESFKLVPDGTKALSIWDNGWKEPILLPRSIHDVAYVPATRKFYVLRTPYATGSAPSHLKVVEIERLEMDGKREVVASFLPTTSNRNFTQLTCPDGEILVVFGETLEIAVFSPNRPIQSSLVPQDLSPTYPLRDNIDSVMYANGWYYLISSYLQNSDRPFDAIMVRTRDFADYKLVSPPLDQPLIHVMGFGDNLYGFVNGAVYRQPMEKGYLDSIIRDQGWRQSDWLGWFQIINEQSGDIDHLLLGDCWVKQVDDQQYWLRTSTLGWIWMNKDWAPWFWRMEDGHWYWLDPDGWPPRAWDYEDQEWEELKP